MSVPSPLVSLVTKRVSPEELCLPSFEVLNCWLNLVASCLDDENEIPLNVIASFSVVRFALLSNFFDSSPQLCKICLLGHGLHKISQFFPFMYMGAFLDVFIQSWQFMPGEVSLAEVVSPGHHVQYLFWYRFLMEYVVCRRDVVRCCFE